MLGVGGLDYTPEPWTPVDSLAWLKAMAWDLRGNMDDEIGRVHRRPRPRPAEVAQLYPAYDDEAHPPIVSQGAVVDGVFEQDATGNATRNPQRPAYAGRRSTSWTASAHASTRLPALLGRGDGIGSNSWVVDGEHTATGMPLLANDPHLGHQPARASGCRWACTAARSTTDCTARRRRLHVLRRARRDHRPQRRHRLGLHQPRPRRHRPLPRAGARQRVELRRRGAAAGGRAPRRSRSAAATTSRSRSARPTTGRCCPTCRASSARVGANAPPTRPTRRPPQTGATATPSPCSGPRCSPARPPTRSWPSTGPATGTSFRAGGEQVRRTRPEHGVRRPRGPHRLPGAGPRADPQVGQRRPAAGRGLAAGERLDRRLRAVRRHCRACSTPRRASSSPPTRRWSGPTTPTTSPTTGTAATARSGSAT